MIKTKIKQTITKNILKLILHIFPIKPSTIQKTHQQKITKHTQKNTKTKKKSKHLNTNKKQNKKNTTKKYSLDTDEHQ